MLAEPQRICFERAERPSVVKGDRGESNVLGRKMSQPIKHVTTDLKIGQTVLLRIKDAFSLRGWLSVYSDATPIPQSAFASLT